jgi:hypothetical protein
MALLAVSANTGLSPSTAERAVSGGGILNGGDTGSGGGSGDGDGASTTLPIVFPRRYEPDGRILGEGGPTVKDGDTYIVNYTAGGGTTGTSGTTTPVPEAQSSLAAALAALSGIFGAFGSTAPASSPTTVATVPNRTATGAANADDSGSGTGKNVVIIAGVVLGLGVLSVYGYKHGWFKKAEKAIGGSGGSGSKADE